MSIISDDLEREFNDQYAELVYVPRSLFSSQNFSIGHPTEHIGCSDAIELKLLSIRKKSSEQLWQLKMRLARH